MAAAKCMLQSAMRRGLRLDFRMPRMDAWRAQKIISGHAGGGICRAIVR